MSSRWSSFRDLYMSVDRRILGAVRISYGVVLLYDLLRRVRVLDLYYSNDGILANHYLLFAPQDRPQFSLLLPFSTGGEVRVAFLVLGVVYALYTLGLFTRVMQVLALVCLTSLNSRNLFAEDGGVSTLIALGLWSAFLPLGDRFSLDALIREARLPTVRARVALRRRLRKPVVSVAVLALTVQILAIYLLNAVQKTGPTWRHGEAVHYVLWQSRISTSFAWWLAHHEPSWFSPLAGRATVLTEAAIPLLVVYPYARATRTIAFGLAVALHTGIALMMTLGPFSYAMMALVLSRLPEEALVWLGEQVPLSLRRSALGWHARAVATLALRVRRGLPPKPPKRPLPWDRIREGTVVVLMLALSTELTHANPYFKLKLPEPEWLRTLIFYPRFTQRWLMFAPEAPTDDGITLVDAVTVKGEHIDPFTGRAPDFMLLEKGPLPHPIEVCDYLFQIHFDFNRPYLRELQRYLEHWHEHGGRTPDDRLVSFEAWWLSRDTPKPGSLEGGPIERTPLAHARFRHEP
jgi:Lipase maturation factor/Vitamin K-dependent gamma-carboxylase